MSLRAVLTTDGSTPAVAVANTVWTTVTVVDGEDVAEGTAVSVLTTVIRTVLKTVAVVRALEGEDGEAAVTVTTAVCITVAVEPEVDAKDAEEGTDEADTKEDADAAIKLALSDAIEAEADTGAGTAAVGADAAIPRNGVGTTVWLGPGTGMPLG